MTQDSEGITREACSVQRLCIVQPDAGLAVDDGVGGGEGTKRVLLDDKGNFVGTTRLVVRVVIGGHAIACIAGTREGVASLIRSDIDLEILCLVQCQVSLGSIQLVLEVGLKSYTTRSRTVTRDRQRLIKAEELVDTAEYDAP